MIKTPTTEKWVEGRDYIFRPGQDEDNWNVGILTGEYIECLIRYNTIRIDEDNLTVHFDYDLLYSPDAELSAADPDLKAAAAEILHTILIGTLNESTGNDNPKEHHPE